jgi:hypothetical protein
MSKHRPWTEAQTEEQKEARERMALFPVGEKNRDGVEEGVEVIFVKGDIWVVCSFLLPEAQSLCAVSFSRCPLLTGINHSR